MSSSDFLARNTTSQPWGEEIWREDESWFTLAQLLWVKLFGSSMSYGQLHYVMSAPIWTSPASQSNVEKQNRVSANQTRSRTYEMELVMDSMRGVLLISEVYGQPGDSVWQPEKIYGRLLDLGSVLVEFFQRELFGDKALLFSPGHVLILRDVERNQLSLGNSLNGVNTVTRDELGAIKSHLDYFMDEHAQNLEIPFRSHGHVVISTLRNIANNSQGEVGGFRTADEIYEAPRLPAWLR